MKPAGTQKRSISITLLLALAVGGLVALSLSVVIGLSLYTNYTNTTELLEQSSSQLVKRIEQFIQSQINPARNVVDYIVKQASLGALDTADKTELTTTLRATLAAAPELTGVIYWRPDGHTTQVLRQTDGRLVVLTSSSKNNKDLQILLNRIKTTKSPVWSRPLRKDGISFISVSSPVYRNGMYVGAVSAGLSIASLSEAMKDVVDGTPFTGFILYDDNFVLAHKNLPGLSKAKLSEKTPLHQIRDIGDPVLASYANGRISGFLPSKNFDVRVVMVNNAKHVVISHEAQLYGIKKWRVGVHVPRSAVSAQIMRIKMSLLVGLALLLASTIAAILLARRVAKPIRKLSKAAMRVGNLELSEITQLPGSRITEIDNQSKAFNQMLEGLKWFESYVPRKLVRKLIREKSDAAVTSRQEDLTVMFTDLIGFTQMSENLSPTDTAAMLNKHFGLINKCIEKTDGTLDKYIGDAVMAFWGAPETHRDHAIRACESALCIVRQMEKDDAGLRMKIALHSGPLIVGNIGAPGRMNYTVIGDTVNTCSRIEKLAGDLDDGSKVIILLSEQVMQALDGRFKTEPAGDFAVKGRQKPVRVYRLKGRS